MQQLIDLLKQACAILQPFTRDVSSGVLVYDGTRYAPAPSQSPDPYALAWWSSFQTTIALLDGLDTLTASQHAYLRGWLCGGMGSFNDFALDPTRCGAGASAANQQLTRVRSSLYAALNELEPNVA